MPGRRNILKALSASAFVWIANPGAVLAEVCKDSPNPGDYGPFYPTTAIPLTDDLTHVPGQSGKAAGQVLYLMGRVQDANCRPLAGVTVEIWHTDNRGHYRHPQAENQDSLDPNFRYFAHVETAADGSYRFKTIRPKAYSVFGLHRAPHVHMKLKRQDLGEVVTEVYFAVPEDDRLRERDQVYKSRGPRGRELIMPLEDPAAHKEITSPEPGSVCCRFDVIYRTA
jgi:protocatechuate 3,4-dioxygenase beta subunit